MATAAGYFDRKPSSAAVRPGLAHLQRDPSSPHTPQRTVSSAFSSPSVSYRAEEEALIFEFGSRHLRAGFTGESYPRCTLGFGTEESRRLGDYRKWLPGYNERPRKKRHLSTWGDDHELWRMDLQGLDLGIVEDRIEKAVREAYSKHLLLDSKSRKLLLIIPSVIPHQLLSTVLSTLFQNFQVPTITLLAPPVLATAAAGCRSSLFIDIGWRETVITATYEYREVSSSRTTRAMKMVTLEVARAIEMHDKRANAKRAGNSPEEKDEAMVSMDLEQAEELTVRLVWCRPRSGKFAMSNDRSSSTTNLAQVSVAGDTPNEEPRENENEEASSISVPSPSSPRQSLQIPFSSLADPVETALFANNKAHYDLDDHEQPLYTLIYKSLLALPPDVRSVCMSRLIFGGGGSNIPGLKSRLLDDVTALVQKRGWNPVYGKAAEERRRRLRETNPSVRAPASAMNEIDSTNKSMNAEPKVALPASITPQEPDPIEEKLRHDHEKGSKHTVSGVVRGVETLGAWAGGSLLAGLRIKAVVEIEKDTFLQHGLAGARRDADVSVLPHKSFGPGIAKAGEKSSWTLGGWA